MKMLRLNISKNENKVNFYQPKSYKLTLNVCDLETKEQNATTDGDDSDSSSNDAATVKRLYHYEVAFSFEPSKGVMNFAMIENEINAQFELFLEEKFSGSLELAPSYRVIQEKEDDSDGIILEFLSKLRTLGYSFPPTIKIKHSDYEDSFNVSDEVATKLSNWIQGKSSTSISPGN